MKLSAKQAVFTINIAHLILFAARQDYGLTFGEAWRPKDVAEIYARQGRGIKYSLHTQRLAADFNLFHNGVWLRKSEDHYELGQYWKQLHPDNCWGGEFRNRDGNHYSMQHLGVK